MLGILKYNCLEDDWVDVDASTLPSDEDLEAKQMLALEDDWADLPDAEEKVDLAFVDDDMTDTFVMVDSEPEWLKKESLMMRLYYLQHGVPEVSNTKV
jgi:hypothetical protein